MNYKINQLAKIAGVSKRTLHFYDQIGLLKPSFNKTNGYRYYEEKEILKLQQILFFKELEFSLDEIKKIMNDPKFDVKEVLKDQKKLLEIKKKRIEGLIKTINKTMKGGEDMKNDDLFKDFSEEQLKEYKKEAKQRWGNTNAYKQSEERTKNWTKSDYKRVAEEQKSITEGLAEAMDLGIESKEVQDLIEKNYKYISQFYDCSLEMYKNLGKMYVEDPRFTAHYDKYKKGLAQFVCDAIAYYCKNKKHV